MIAKRTASDHAKEAALAVGLAVFLMVAVMGLLVLLAKAY